jgi:hypothetical protein
MERNSLFALKQLGREADHSPPSSAKVKNAWSYISILPIRLLWSSAQLKHRDNFSFTLLKELLFATPVTKLFCFKGMH